MTSFTEVFGGSAVSPADVAYAAYDLPGTVPGTQFYWPQFSDGQTNVVARFMSITVAASAGFGPVLPDATLASVGFDTIIFNAGSDAFAVLSSVGNIVVINPGDVFYLLLTDNSTPQGTWTTFQFGVGTGSAVASELAGAGLVALAGLLAVNMNAVMVSASYTLTLAARDILQVWTGGSGTITLPPASAAGNGFMFPFANNGSGSVTITPVGGDEIDGGSTSVFTQTQSGFVISTGTGWVTVGKGIQNTFAVTLLNLNVAGSSNVTETSAQAQNIIQQFTGVLTGNINVIVPNTVQIYYIYNNTSGAFSLQVKTAAGTGITVTQGSHAILYCDGTNVLNAFTATITSTLTIPAGSASSPSLNVSGSLTTGLFSAAANTISVAAGGNEVTRFASAASAVNYITQTSAAIGNGVTIGAAGVDATIPINIAGKGVASTVNITNPVTTGGTIDGATIGASSQGTVKGTTITATTGFAGNLTGNVTGSASLNLQIASNLSDVANAATSLTNLGGLSSATAASTYAPLASPPLTGNPTAPTQTAGNSSTRIATTAFVNGTALTLATGTTAVTQAEGDSSTKVATTAFANPSQSLTSNGFFTLPGGGIIAWGTTPSIGTGSHAFSFPNAFPNNCFSAHFQPTNNGSTSAIVVSSGSLTASGCTLQNNTGNGQAFLFLAVGN